MKRIGASAWIVFAITFFEINLFIKNYEPNDYQEPLPNLMKMIWVGIFVIVLALYGWLITKDIKNYMC